MRTRRAWRNGPMTWLWGVLSTTGTAPLFRPHTIDDEVEAYQKSIDDAIAQGMVFAKGPEA